MLDLQPLPAEVLPWSRCDWRCNVVTSVLDQAVVHKGCGAACSMASLGCRIACTPCQCLKLACLHVFCHLQHGSTQLDKGVNLAEAACSM